MEYFHLTTPQQMQRLVWLDESKGNILAVLSHLIVDAWIFDGK